jgi:CheY-like chemotaxis protein
LANRFPNPHVYVDGASSTADAVEHTYFQSHRLTLIPSKLPGLIVSIIAFLSFFYLKQILTAPLIAERDLRESEERFHQLAENLEEIFWITSIDGEKNLSARGFEVEVAEAGEEAMETIYSNQPHIVFLDVMMPRLTGDELVKMIKDWKPEIQVIMVSANLRKDVEEECMRNGASACITKPVKFDLLTEVIHQALS